MIDTDKTSLKNEIRRAGFLLKVLDVSEVIDAIDQLIKEKAGGKEINAIRESVQKLQSLMMH
ncbi:hypothetical protein PO124_02830 [Bacillus licheniformis]|nr:hypothetical protein [Bacillus licheniformis]